MADQVTRNINVNADVDHVYQLWSHFKEFPRFMKYIDSVSSIGEGLTHWVMHDPLGRRLEWDAKTTRMERNKRIAWNSLDGGDIKTSGQILFNQLPNGQTAITATLQYATTGIGEVVASLLNSAEAMLEADLNNFKEMAEATASATRPSS